ncbi:hypothetical protein DYU11_18510 [Fibrisoma montanum]|uniref:Uncharacterized protein n=1 Tax=Fibrisoma montanum TaxID=2305895 RepID=A0A418M623_9BACT|nr:hypothetical protein DYU11_18510 [Fibrisoma montanum]
MEGLTCTVNLLNTGLQGDAAIPGVNLRANDEAKEGVLLVPRKDSVVFVAAVENDMNNMFVVFVSEVDKVECIIDKMKVSVDKDVLKAEREKVSLQLDTKLTAANDKVSLVLEPSKLTAANDGKVTMTLEASKATMKQEAAVIELSAGKISIKNGSTSLKQVLDQLLTTLIGFKVICAAPGSPSAPFPADVTAFTNLKATLNNLLQ